MKIIIPISQKLLNDWSNQVYYENYSYKLIKYIKFIKVNEGYLLYNLLTRELILISNKEYNDIQLGLKHLQKENVLLHRYLATHWFLIPEEMDEKTLAHLQHCMYIKPQLVSNYINSYTILTTTDCNARCYYCYEKGVKRTPMSEQTALDVAEYIVTNCDHNQNVSLTWFGGEPLYNYKVIDIICNYLKENDIKFTSGMITNGYLFNDEIINKAKNEWNLRHLQITLDGTEEVYNKTKAYIYKGINAFERILNNIENLVNNSIYVNIRYNLSEKNAKDLYKLSDLLCERFDPFKMIRPFYISVAPLFENMANNLLVRTKEQRESIYDEVHKLEEYLRTKGLKPRRFSLDHEITQSSCMACNPESCIITPDGNIGSCEHFVDKNFHASIYSSPLEYNYSEKRIWKKLYKYYNIEGSDCDNCYYFPKCIKLLHCEPSGKCDEPYRKRLDLTLEEQLISEFDMYKDKHKDVIDKFIEKNNEV